MLSSVKLTVGIPTYNRATELRVALENVLAQACGRLRNNMEILISDNASPDATRALADEYVSRYPDLVSYHCNAGNLGYSRNVDTVIRRARGEYVLLLSDDDSLEDNTLERVWDILGRFNDLGAVFLTPTPYDPDLQFPLVPLPPGGQDGGTLYRPGLDYVRLKRIFPPFLMSGYVVRREAWSKVDCAVFLETLCVHTLAVLPILQDYAVYVSHAPSIRYRTDTRGCPFVKDSLFPFTFYLDLLVGCCALKAIYPPRLHRYLHRQAMRSIAYHIMELKVLSGPIQTRLLLSRMEQLADVRDPLYWLNRLLLFLPRWVIGVPFKIAFKGRSLMRGGAA